MEAASGFEPLNKGFADLCLTTWLRRLKFQTTEDTDYHSQCSVVHYMDEMERETGFEPATPTLARLYSTTELFPLVYIYLYYFAFFVN